MKITGLFGYGYDFSVDYESFDIGDIFDIHKFIMKEHKWLLNHYPLTLQNVK